MNYNNGWNNNNNFNNNSWNQQPVQQPQQGATNFSYNNLPTTQPQQVFQQPIVQQYNNGWNQPAQPIWTLTKQVRDNQNNLVDVYQNQFNGVMMVPSQNNNNNYLQNPLYNNASNTPYSNAGITYMGGAV